MRFIGFFMFLFSFSMAQAQIVFSPGISYFKYEEENAGVTSELEISNYDLKLGYLHPSGLYLGGMYNMSKLNDDDGFAAGPTVGYSHYSGFYALFTYHLIAEHDIGAGAKYTDGMGPQIDLGWVFPLTSVFHLGPQLTYRSIGYDKAEAGGASVNTDVTRSYMLPYISLWFKF